MVSTADFRNGMIILLDGELMQIVEFQHVKPGKGGAFVRTRFKNVLTGRVLEKTFRSGEKFDEAVVEERTLQYLYHDGDLYHFMDKDTFEQIEVSESVASEAMQWIKENTDAVFQFHDGKAISVRPPFFVVLEITQCDPGVQGDRATGGTKPATLETGAVVQVPLYIQQNTVIKVDTRTATYIERVG